jgi:hypothetical protein
MARRSRVEAKGFTPGSSVSRPAPGRRAPAASERQVREQIRTVGCQVVDEHCEALQILAEHDPDAKTHRR